MAKIGNGHGKGLWLGRSKFEERRKGTLMPTIITNYTTYELRYHYADTRRLPRLSKEEERILIASLAPPTTPSLPAQQINQVKQRLIERHLGLATRIAIDLCPLRWPSRFADPM
jgi:hypothetical protein